jgi:hypothetical protein
LCERIQVQLQRFAFDNALRFARDLQLHDTRLRLAAPIEPGQLKRRPHVHADKRQCRIRSDADRASRLITPD